MSLWIFFNMEKATEITIADLRTNAQTKKTINFFLHPRFYDLEEDILDSKWFVSVIDFGSNFMFSFVIWYNFVEVRSHFLESYRGVFLFLFVYHVLKFGIWLFFFSLFHINFISKFKKISGQWISLIFGQWWTIYIIIAIKKFI